ncbi:nuclear transport factor 2 family protein [Georgenia sp. Z1344]|uniref:nuclear transport factor 2 family protein n=1 Tax=Georgenia sp. Z1344 TaxID=3416706 RepID=UPI003CF6C4FC
MTTAEDLARRHVDAFNEGDADRLLADFTPDATWVTGDYSAPAGELQEFFRGAMRSLRPRLTLHRVIDGGRAIAVEMTERWTHENETRTAALVAVLDIADGLISGAKIYREGSSEP